MRLAALRHLDLPAARRLLERACVFDQCDKVAEETLFGPSAIETSPQAVGAFSNEELVGLACVSKQWLRVLAVDPGYRRQGVGKMLLGWCEARAEFPIRVMDEPGNYLSPGVDARNTESIAWLSKYGYRETRRNCNLLLDLPNNKALAPAAIAKSIDRVQTCGYQIREGTAQDRDRSSSIAANFSAGWAFEFAKALASPLGGVFVAERVADNLGGDDRNTSPGLNLEFAGFAVHDGNNAGLGWFGPTGTLSKHRGNGIGTGLLQACLHNIYQRGHRIAEVAWIGPRDFYEKVAGPVRDRHFVAMQKDTL